ncbi:hypothetical protein GUJ93_ZPchr0006g44434 [Zizania palustris]|uniref:Phosphofructokinase domain-containing protein n=1 Tax=Zizania palustris TaxID=103762 RepID=A0A8J5W4V2_ZIZPA|nr:hypothetical protein GUJ93_ZPchr0006g44434 [Zizania palustris]
MDGTAKPEVKLVIGDAGYVLEDVPHVSDYLHDFPYFVNPDDTVCQKIAVHKNGPRGNHFRRAGPRQRVYFESDEVRACIVTCGGLCPGMNTVIREIGGYRGFYACNTIDLTPKSVNDIHKRGGTILGTSRGGHDTKKIVALTASRIVVYVIGGDGTQRGAGVIFEDHFKKSKTTINLKYIDPTYMIRAIPSNASDNVYCTLLAHSVVPGAMAGYTGFTVGQVNGRHCYIPITEKQNKVSITDRMWARLLSSTNQPSFLSKKDVDEAKMEEERTAKLWDGPASNPKVEDEVASNGNGVK